MIAEITISSLDVGLLILAPSFVWLALTALIRRERRRDTASWYAADCPPWRNES